MRTRTLIAAALLPVVLIACDRGSRMDAAEEADLGANLELALPASAQSEQAVASAIELPPPPPAENVQPVVRRTPPQQRAPEPTPITAPEAPLQPVEPAVVAETQTQPTSGPSHEHEPAAATGRTPLEAKGGVIQSDGDRTSNGTGIMIRGGVSRGYDPCAVHRVPPEITLTTPPPLINERVPQVGGNRIPVGGMGDPETRTGGVSVGRGGVTSQGPAVGNRGGQTARGGIGSTGSRGGVGTRGGMRGGIR